MKRMIFCGLMICLFSTRAQAISYDGKWWNEISSKEREEFYTGYLDCAIYDAGQPAPNLYWYQLEAEITKYYSENSSDIEKPVIAVFWQIYSTGKLKPREITTGGEPHPGKHGLFDGDYWRLLFFDNQKLRFIEGYLVCQREFKKPEASFSREAQWYVDQITKWYGWYGLTIPNEPEDINEEHYPDKIADVLYRLKD